MAYRKGKMTEQESCETKRRLEESRKINPVQEGGSILQDYEVYATFKGNNHHVEKFLTKANFDHVDYVPNGCDGEFINAIGVTYKYDSSGKYIGSKATCLILKRIDM